MKEFYSKTGEPFPITMILKIVNLSSSSWYGKIRRKPHPLKRGRKPVLTDDEVLNAIYKTLKNSKFKGEGYRKIWKRMQRKGIKVDKMRVNRIMKANNLLSPYRINIAKKSKSKHDGKIITNKPNLMWGTDGKKFFTNEDGWCWLFAVIDHFNDEILGVSVVKIGNRFAAMEPIYAAIRNRFGNIEKDICKDMELQLRSDHGSQYDSKDFMNEMKFLGLKISKSFVRSPECNGCIERFNRTIQEEVFNINTFQNIEEARTVINTFINDYNNEWLIHRLGTLSPIEYINAFYKTFSTSYTNTASKKAKTA